MRTNIKRIDMLKILLLAKFKDSKFCYIIILRVAKQLIQLNNNYRYSDNSGSDEQFMMLGDAELSRRFSMQDEAEQKAKIDREQANELE